MTARRLAAVAGAAGRSCVPLLRAAGADPTPEVARARLLTGTPGDLLACGIVCDACGRAGWTPIE
jgi:hypothetical protein